MSSITADRRQRTLFLTLVFSILFHIGVLWFLNSNEWLLFKPESLEKTIPEEVTFLFPENKPAEKRFKIVENQNANNLKPDDTGLLADQNSQARNMKSSDKTGALPQSNGNTDLINLSNPSSERGKKTYTQKQFSREALTGYSKNKALPRAEKSAAYENVKRSQGTNERMKQQEQSVLEVGGLTLSTYRWQWAPYVYAMKRKLKHVWIAPAAYYRLGLVHGASVIKFTINRDGSLAGMQLLRHKGHESLQISSMQAIEALFKFLPLPDDFPEESLTIIAELTYPDLTRGR